MDVLAGHGGDNATSNVALIDEYLAATSDNEYKSNVNYSEYGTIGALLITAHDDTFDNASRDDSADSDTTETVTARHNIEPVIELPSNNSSDDHLASIDTGPAINAKHEAGANPTAHDSVHEDILLDMFLLFYDSKSNITI